MEKVKIKIEKEKERLDKALSSLMTDRTRAFIQKLIKDGRVSVDGNVVTKSGFMARAGQNIEVTFPELKKIEAKAEKIDLDILHEDDDIIIINKPPFMVVHPSSTGGHTSGTLVNAILHHCGDTLSGISGELRPGIVHRLDKNTSGVLVVAKTDLAHQSLMQQFKDRKIRKKYITLVKGAVSPEKAVINSPVGRSFRDRKKMAITSDGAGRDAVTEYSLNEFYQDSLSDYSLLDIDLKTGRTHQIRVHMNAIKHPVIGDITYGNKKLNAHFLEKYGLKRQFLHAAELEITHPKTGKKVKFEAKMPKDLLSVLDALVL
ncbi:RluA family pseudouridine synthase [Candidatus Peregrinibacteria bacterium]|jgi:23S rRNA pseudouridine1911/1915/1917 synthase|nr:RluA family pseudouridine synthase [Candidatus Peregrinibacteria bacterium]MBT4148315.1 RluA family pseudouridine synthase [Candidatus Peregrinibacteria bacterium]MBT4366404.1 RluA family pseudouridine synthase [Candidatus Peregrinibacteria bacterium]MBT4455932.1 RluA family pseudouridine synthase [Candidatus Peregrinibacteria bacterium]